MLHRRIRIGCTFTYVAEIDTPVIFQVKPRASPDVAIDYERWASEPYMPVRGYEDLYGNPCVRAVLPAGRSTFGYEGVAVVPMLPRTPTRTLPSPRPVPCLMTP